MKLRAGLSAPVGLLLLSALWALDWLLPDLFPGSVENVFSLPLRQAILFSAFTAIATSLVIVRGQKFLRGSLAWKSAWVGVGFFVIPTGGVAFAQHWTSSLDGAAVLCLTPLFAVVLDPYLQDCPPRRGRGSLAGALIAVAGILFLIPLETPSSFRQGVALIVLVGTSFTIAATNCVAVRLARAAGEGSAIPIAAQAGGASALCFALAASFAQSGTWGSNAVQLYLLRLFVIDLPGLFLLFWLIARMSASRMTARFLLAPLLASLAGLTLERILPPPRAWLGIVLLAGGSAWLVLAPAESETEELNMLPTIALHRPNGRNGGTGFD